MYVVVGMLGLFYAFFVVYLTVYMLVCLGWESLVECRIVQKYYRVDDFVQDRAHKKEDIKMVELHRKDNNKTLH